MSWPTDGRPRFVVNPDGSMVLDRAWCHQVVADFHQQGVDNQGVTTRYGTRWTRLKAAKRCAELNENPPA